MKWGKLSRDKTVIDVSTVKALPTLMALHCRSVQNHGPVVTLTCHLHLKKHNLVFTLSSLLYNTFFCFF